MSEKYQKVCYRHFKIEKVIVFAKNRKLAIKNTQKVFSSAKIESVKTNIPLFNEFLQTIRFRNGIYATFF
ncbi:hypothetical protein [Psychrobacillus soli]|uniref:hypothetical protein n=1 Tax=Psychrobacillus soli TaxID=1543965 RepID=UPI00163CE871